MRLLGAIAATIIVALLIACGGSRIKPPSTPSVPAKEAIIKWNPTRFPPGEHCVVGPVVSVNLQDQTIVFREGGGVDLFEIKPSGEVTLRGVRIENLSEIKPGYAVMIVIDGPTGRLKRCLFGDPPKQQ